MNSEQAVEPVVDLITEVLAGMCHYPGSLRIEVDEHGQSWPKINIFPHAADRPIIIGPGGRTIQGLQSIGAKLGFQIQLYDPIEGEREPMRPFRRDPNFDVEAFTALCERFGKLLWPPGVSITHEYEQRPGKDDRMVLRFSVPSYDLGALALLTNLESFLFPYAKAKGETIKFSPFKK